MTTAVELFAARFLPGGPSVDGNFCVSSLTGGAAAFAALALVLRRDAPAVTLVVTPGIPDAERLVDDLRLLTAAAGTRAGTVRVLEFPPHLAGDTAALGARFKAIAALRAWGHAPAPLIVVAPSPALARPLPAGTLPSLTLDLRVETHPAAPRSFEDICRTLAEIGYNRVPTVEQEGDFSVRGGILDIWSPGEEFPVRAEFFGDDLESLRAFDAATQISVARLTSATFLPLREAPPAGTRPDTDAAEPDARSAERTIFSLLPPASTVFALEHTAYTLPDTRAHQTVFSGDPAPRGVPTHPFQTVPLPGFAELGADEAHHPELFDAARRRLERHLSAAEARGEHILRLDDLSGGFEIPAADGRAGLVVVTKADRVFSKKKTRRLRNASAPATGVRLTDFDDLEPGEHVVHVDYGIGRFIGSSEILVDGKRSEVFTIEYADEAKLHVPAAHAHLLSRYVGIKGETVKLHRLDGKRWNKDKASAQKAVADLAAALLDTQARREIAPGFVYDTACDGLDAFEAAFPYDETPDQAAAIAAVKKDLASPRPMDRLICGDAGYGKTEVAMRAAYIAALNGRQVAVLAPTTVLAEQHFETFTARFDGTPVRIESVSRFQTAGVHAGTFQRLATGVCDIVIGTHAILSSKIAFRDLGLIIIDEEQRFGVRHKEFLKNLRATADVLTLSATPIPRTLYLSMTGARDLSLLRSPPRERVAVDTKIVTDSDEIVAAAIDAELARGGQVFFLHNRVATIGKIDKRLRALCPAARIVVAHGQMDARTLARKMRAFEQGEYDILLSTTIIESGIDIPRANTILVDRADLFGLADLYQLRGRVGRGSRQGRAVFLLPTGGVDSDARERLAALKRHGSLGAGFNLALRDLELRGAGNLLGARQSGHIAAVGFGLYCQLLRRTVAALKGEKTTEIVDVKLNLDFIDLSPASDDPDAAAALPYSYVEEDAQRMSFMKRFGEATDLRVVRALARELHDRFGRPPPAARRLLRLVELRVRAARAGIGIIDAAGTRAVFYRNATRTIETVLDFKGRTPDRKIQELLAALKPAAA
jgi:transcription-repair coupling factor (superfamily II helicase)